MIELTEEFSELLRDTFDEITVNCGFLVDEITEYVDNEDKRKELIDYIGKIDGAIYELYAQYEYIKDL